MLRLKGLRPVISLFDVRLNGKRDKTSQQGRDLREQPLDGGLGNHELVAQHLRLHGRPPGMFTGIAKDRFLAAGEAWPTVIQHPETDTVEVPATAMGLIALVASWDSLMTDNEYAAFRSMSEQIIPMGLIGQTRLEHNQHHHLTEEHLHHDHGG